MKDNRRLEIRAMTRGELDLACDWAAVEGWNPGLYDAECFYRTDPHGFFIGLLDGEPIGSISAVAYGKSYGFLGFYIVKPDYRGQGFGIQLWNAGMERLQGRNIGLDGVVAQQDNYKKSGFTPAYRSVRYRWEADAQRSVVRDVVQLSEVPKEKLGAYDLRLFGVDRRQFLECWISRPQTESLGVLHEGNPVGYGVLRKCRNGFKMGPLFADDLDIADLLFRGLTANLDQGTEVFLDVPQVNLAAVRLASEKAMTPVFETARMYVGGAPNIPVNRWFSVTSFELG